MGEAKTKKAKASKVSAPKVETLESRLDAWIQKQTEFTLTEAVEFLLPFEGENETPERVARDVNTMIFTDGLAFSTEQEPEKFYPCQAFFAGKKFAVSRFEHEKKLGVLIPGGRFAPFCHHAVLPSEMTLIGPDGKKLPKKKIKMSIEDAAAYYNLLGSEEMFHFFEAEHIDNVATLKVADVNAELKLEVYDVSHLDNATTLSVTVKDWSEGVFEIAPTQTTAINDVPAWLQPFEKALYKVFERYSYYIEIPEQIRQALFNTPTVLSGDEPFELDRFLATSDSIEIILIGSRTLLWRNDENPPEVQDPNQLPEGMALTQSNVDSLPDILAELKCPLTPVEIEATMRDELYQGRSDFNMAFERLFRTWDLEFTDSTQETYFMNYLEALWEDVNDGYDRIEDQQNGRVRHFALAINKERLKWLSRISQSGHIPDEHQQKILQAITERSNLIMRLLETTNLREEFADPTEADAVLESLTALADQLDGLMQHYDADVEHEASHS